MVRVVHVGRHELRIAAVEPALVYVRFAGEVVVEEARVLAPLVGNEIGGRAGRLLVDASDLETVDKNSRGVFAAGSYQPAQAGCVVDILFIRASMLHKVVLSQVVSMASQNSPVRVQTHFFDALDDALGWLGLPSTLLFAADEV